MEKLSELAFSQYAQGIAGVTAGLAAAMSLKTSNKTALFSASLLSVAVLVAQSGTRYFLKRSRKDDVPFSWAVHSYLKPANIIGGVVAITTVVYSNQIKQLPKVLQSAAYGFGIGFFVNLMGDLVYVFFDRNPKDEF